MKARTPQIVNAEHEVQKSVERLDRAIARLDSTVVQGTVAAREQLSGAVLHFQDHTAEAREIAHRFIQSPREAFDRFVAEKLKAVEAYVADRGSELEGLAVDRFEKVKAELNQSFDEAVELVEHAVFRMLGRVADQVNAELTRLEERPLTTWLALFAAGVATGVAASLVISSRLKQAKSPGVAATGADAPPAVGISPGAGTLAGAETAPSAATNEAKSGTAHELAKNQG